MYLLIHPHIYYVNQSVYPFQIFQNVGKKEQVDNVIKKLIPVAINVLMIFFSSPFDEYSI